MLPSHSPTHLLASQGRLMPDPQGRISSFPGLGQYLKPATSIRFTRSIRFLSMNFSFLSRQTTMGTRRHTSRRSSSSVNWLLLPPPSSSTGFETADIPRGGRQVSETHGSIKSFSALGHGHHPSIGMSS